MMAFPSNTRITWITALVAGLACGGFLAAEAWPEANATKPKPGNAQVAPAAVAVESVSHGPGAAGAQASDPDFLTAPDVLFFSSPTLSRYWTVAGDRKSLRISTYELFPPDEIGDFNQDVSTTFSIRDIAPRGGDELFVAGNPARGGFLIERWRVPQVRGSTTATIAPTGSPPGGTTATPGVGVPTQPWVGQVLIPGVSQIPLQLRDPTPPVQRTAFAEDVNCLYQGIGADPEGRFVLVVTDTGELRQYFPSLTLDDYVVLEDGMSVPQLEHVEGLFHRVQHAVFGRVWFLTWFDARYQDDSPIPASLRETIVMVDGDNDGFFEQVTPHFVEGTTIDAYLDRSQWLDDFMSPP